MTLNISELTEFSSQIIKEAGELLIVMKKMPFEFQEKKNHGDLVTIVDQKIEEYLVQKIQEKYPEHGILGEEGIIENEISAYDTVWVIDPIDGTTNFLHNFPFYGISIGIVHKNEGVVGLVYNPSTDELFLGVKDKGAFINGKKIQIENEIELKDTVVSTSMFWKDATTKDALDDTIIQLYKETRGMRMVGGAAVSLGEIAKGTFNAYVMAMLSPWDYAGGVIFLEQAGGIVSRIDGTKVDLKESGSLIASHPSIHKELVNMFKNREK